MKTFLFKEIIISIITNIMRGYQKHSKKQVGKHRARGNNSKSVDKYGNNLYRLGAGKKGRKKIGNSASDPNDCHCHPLIKPKFLKRVKEKKQIKKNLMKF